MKGSTCSVVGKTGHDVHNEKSRSEPSSFFAEAEITYTFTFRPVPIAFVGAQTGRTRFVPSNLPQGGNVTRECNSFVRDVDIST